MTLGSSIPIAHGSIAPTVAQRGLKQASPEMSGMGGFSTLQLGIVVRVDPCNQEIDAALLNGGIVHNVPVINALAGTSEGEYVLPNIKTPKKKDDQSQQQAGQQSQQDAGQQGQSGDQSGQSEEDDSDGRVDWKDIKDAELYKPSYERDTWAIIGYVNSTSRTPVCLGFLRPHSTQLSIKGTQEKKEDRIDYMRRLTSQTYELRTRGGVYEDNYPDGTHLRVGKPKESGGSGQQQQQSQSQAGAPTDPTQQGPTSNPQTQSSGGDDYYDDDDSDPDGRIVLGKDQYENKDKDDKPWKIKKSKDGYRWFVVHSSKTKFGIDENGRIHHQYYKNKDQESDAPDGSGDDGDSKFNHAHTDAHQTRFWRMGFGNPENAPGPEDKVVDGENWYDPKNNRNRFHLPQPSDGQYSGASDVGAGGGSSGAIPMPGFGGGGPNTFQNGGSGVADFPPHTGEVHFQNQIGQTGGLAKDAHGNYFPFATTDGHAVSFADHHHGEGPGAIDVLTGPNGRFIAPVSGFVDQSPIPGAGNIVRLQGDNGIDYWSGHTSGIASGRVTAGTPIGAIEPLGSTTPFGPGSGKEDLLHGHYLITQRGQFPDPGGHGTMNPYTGSGAVDGLKATAMANGGEPGSPPGTFGAVSDPEADAGNQPSEGANPDNANEDTSQPQTKWYMPAATPRGGGVPKKLKGIKAKPSDQDSADSDATGPGSATGSELQKNKSGESEDGSKSKDGVLIDAAAEDHEHRAFVADDNEIKETADANKGGKSENLARGDHEHKDKDAGSGTSDERFKTDISTLTEAVHLVNQIRVVTYNWNDKAQELGIPKNNAQIGVIAQELQKILPEVVLTFTAEDHQEYYKIDYARLSVLALAGVQELDDRLQRIEKMLGIEDAA